MENEYIHIIYINGRVYNGGIQIYHIHHNIIQSC